MISYDYYEYEAIKLRHIAGLPQFLLSFSGRLGYQKFSSIKMRKGLVNLLKNWSSTKELKFLKKFMGSFEKDC